MINTALLQAFALGSRAAFRPQRVCPRIQLVCFRIWFKADGLQTEQENDKHGFTASIRSWQLCLVPAAENQISLVGSER